MMIAHYRSDIDGIRAIAVLSVILFHFDMLGLAPGGFVGVDIFFVISGYLISRILIEDMTAGTYSIAAFYKRRIRRIFPALFTVFAASMMASLVLSFPSEARETGRSIVAAIFFVSNIMFYKSSDYFDTNSERNPLLHTWSLSVEEQFYVAFPIIIWALRGLRPSGRTTWLAALTLASFGYACWLVRADHAAAFYLTPSRAWELLLGALLASGAVPLLRARWQAEIVGVGGGAFVLGSIMLMSRNTSFPGEAALFPCLGAVALIYCGMNGSTFVGRLLACAPMRFIGLISYSLYLWHWPVLVFYKEFDEPIGWEKVVLILGCIVLATLSYLFVERPFRSVSRGTGPRRAIMVSGVAMAAISAMAMVLGPVSQTLYPVPKGAERVLAYVRYKLTSEVRADRCFLTGRSNGLDHFSQDECLALLPGRSNVLVLGDSHAAHLWPGLNASFPRVNFLQATASSCVPVVPAHGERRCRELLDLVVNQFLPVHRLDAIVLSARWSVSDIPDLQQTVTALRRYVDRVIVFGPIVEYEQALPRILAKGIGAKTAGIETQYRRSMPLAVDRALAAGLASGPAEYLSVRKVLCRPECVVWADAETPLQFDYGHLTQQGSALLASRLNPKLFAQVSNRQGAARSSSEP